MSTDASICDKKKPKLPLVYRKEYNVRFCGLEKLHPFDASKWRNIFSRLKEPLQIDENYIYMPMEVTEGELLKVHTRQYLNSLKWSCNVARIAEIPLIALVPNFIIQKVYLRAMRFQVSGTVLAGQLALKYGSAINIGGGFHHCCRNAGMGFCPYADISLLIYNLFRDGRVQKIMIVDLDAHQGNGHERDFLMDDRVFILDVYNGSIFPRDSLAKQGINCCLELSSYTEDLEYLNAVERCLEKSLKEFHPDIIIYNAGTDILEGDPLGRLSISPNGIIARDKIVFSKARDEHIPIVMLTSGGYLKESAEVIAKSIINLFNLKLIG